GAGPSEEDGEDEGQRDQRLLAAREEREFARRLAGRRHLDLDPELVAALFLLLELRLGGVLLARHLLLTRRPLVVANRPQAAPTQPAATAWEEVGDHLLEVGRGCLEGLLEGALDLRVDVADQRLQLAHAPLGVLALGLQRLDVLARLLVLALG